MNILKMSLHKVFVYGTLKKGEPNHSWIQDKTKGSSHFLNEAETEEKYPLIIGTRYNIPFLLDVPGRGHNVHGEVYKVDDGMLKHLDSLEDHPNFYVREKRPMKILPSGDREPDCWVYLIKRFRPDLLSQPYLQDYHSEGPHGLRYMENLDY